MWCLPTHKRPEKLRRFINSMGVIDRREKVLLMVWEDDPRRKDYEMMDLPQMWKLQICRERFCGDKMNRAFLMFPRETFYGLLTDDVEIETKGMLPTLRKVAESGYFTWPNDGVWGEKLGTHPVAPGDFIRALGFWAHPQFQHNGIDSVLFVTSKELGIHKYDETLRLKVNHPAFDTAAMDETYEDAKKLNEQFSFRFDLFVRAEMPKLMYKLETRLCLTTEAS